MCITVRSNKHPHSDEDLRIAANYFEQHVKMYVATLLWLIPRVDDVSIQKNAYIVAHLIHMRVIVDFLSRNKSNPEKYPHDVIAKHYFHDCPKRFRRLSDKYLREVTFLVGSRAAHLTIKEKTNLISDLGWDLICIAQHLCPKLREFLIAVPKERFPQKDSLSCLNHIHQLGY